MIRSGPVFHREAGQARDLFHFGRVIPPDPRTEEIIRIILSFLRGRFAPRLPWSGRFAAGGERAVQLAAGKALGTDLIEVATSSDDSLGCQR
jgi:hypothetical protein